MARPQFSLKTLLAGVTVTAVASAAFPKVVYAILIFAIVAVAACLSVLIPIGLFTVGCVLFERLDRLMFPDN